MKPSRIKRSQDRLLDRAIQAPWDPSIRDKWALLSDEPFENRLQDQKNEREAEDMLIVMVAYE